MKWPAAPRHTFLWLGGLRLSEMARRIAAILLMGPTLDANYAAPKTVAVEWKDGAPVEQA